MQKGALTDTLPCSICGNVSVERASRFQSLGNDEENRKVADKQAVGLKKIFPVGQIAGGPTEVEAM